MSSFAGYEIEVLSRLLNGVFPSDAIQRIVSEGEFAGYEYTGVGYYCTLRHVDLPQDRHVCDRPAMIGESDGLQVGFVAFLENRELVLECFAYGDVIPENFRSREVSIRVAE